MTRLLLLVIEPLLIGMIALLNGFRDLFAWVDRTLGFALSRRKFRRILGYWPNFEQPQTFNEKIHWRKFYDPAPVYTVISDKLRLQDYVHHRLGADRAQGLLPNRRLVTARPTAADLAAIGTGVIIKPNHGSAWYRIVAKGTKPDYHRLALIARCWLRLRYGQKRHEWAYRDIVPQIMVEDLVLGENGHPAMDVKFHMMDGVCQWIEVMYDRHHQTQFATATADWLALEIDWKNYRRGALPNRPKDFAQMRAVAQDLSAEFDYIRVDFLCGDAEWKLNELTLYESSGLAAYQDPSVALRFGQLWKHRKYDGDWGKAAPVMPKP